MSIISLIPDNINVCVESGLWLGATTLELSKIPHIQQVHSIELGTSLYNAGCERFRNNKKVKLWHGDSGKMLGSVMDHIIATVDEPTVLLYLDAHYSGGVGPVATVRGTLASPLRQELKSLVQYDQMIDTILIDDIRAAYDFSYDGGNPLYLEGWPSIDEVYELLRNINPLFDIEVNTELRPNHILIAKKSQ